MPYRLLLAAALSLAAVFGQSFVCHESVERYRDRRYLDTITASVLVSEGVEQYSDIHQNGIPLASLSDVPGAWSRNEYSALYRGAAWSVRLAGQDIALRFRERRSSLRVEREAHPHCSGVCSLSWSIQLQQIHVAGRLMTFPQEGFYVVRYPGYSDWNRISFSGCQTFVTESLLLLHN